MKILCDRNQLQEAFSFVAGIAAQKTPKPILQNVLLDAQQDRATFYATDQEILARVDLKSVKVSRPGKALLPAKETGALLRELTDPTVTITGKEFRCTLESGGGSFVLVGDDPDKFPTPTLALEGEQSFSIPTLVFLNMVRKTIFATAREESRYTINGLLIDCREDCVRFVATDGRRLALNYHNLSGTGHPTLKVVVPVRALQVLARAVAEEEKGEIRITCTENQAGFQFGDSLLITQLLENSFPDYEVVIPKRAETSCDLDRDLLERCVRQVAVLSSGDLRVIRLNFENQTLELSAESSDKGRADQVMPADVKGAGGALSFNPDFLLEALKVTDQAVVRLDMSDDSKPAKMSLGEAFTYVLMPISGT
jgi:DNA polymerase-3 subunit beta